MLVSDRDKRRTASSLRNSSLEGGEEETADYDYYAGGGSETGALVLVGAGQGSDY